MNYLLDTCVISELVAKEPDPQVVNRVDRINDEQLYLSVITIGEIQRGIAKLPTSHRKSRLEEWLRRDLLRRFQGRVLPVTLDVMLTWGNLTAKGRTLPAIDSLIAATALHHQLCLVTRNVKDFDGTDVQRLNPWEGR